MHSIEDLIEHKEELAILTDQDMQEICDILRHANPNWVGAAEEESDIFDISINIGSFYLQKSKLGHCRIVKRNKNGKDVRLAHGTEMLFVGFIYLKVIEKKQLSMITDREYGIVFGGGGARGAYEIGVWKALEETGLAKQITGIAGSSVGALNALLFAQGDIEKAKNVWLNVEKKDLTKWGPIIHYKKHLTASDEKQITPNEIVSNVLDVGRGISIGIFSNNLSSIIDDAIDNWKCISDNKIIYSCATLRGWLSGRDSSKNISLEWHKAVHIPLVGLDKKDIKEYVIASASIPFVYPKQQIDHLSLVDGGFKNNEPYQPLVNAKYKKIIVVHLDFKKNYHNYSEIRDNSRLYHVFPSSHLGRILDINKVKTMGRIELGYKDMTTYLDYLGRIWK